MPETDVIDLLIGRHARIQDLFAEVLDTRGEERERAFRHLVEFRVKDAGTALGKVVTRSFETAGRLRHARVFHPKGRMFGATLRLDGDELFGEPGPREVVVRISKGTSTPGALPDVLGIAVRVPTSTDPVDLLFASSGGLPVLRHALMPRRSFTGGPYTTLVPYRVEGRARVLGLMPPRGRSIPALLSVLDDAVAAAPITFVFCSAAPAGPWARHGVLEIHSPMKDDPPSAFDPQLHRLPELRPIGPLQTLRRLAYQGSRRGRGAS